MKLCGEEGKPQLWLLLMLLRSSLLTLHLSWGVQTLFPQINNRHFFCCNPTPYYAYRMSSPGGQVMNIVFGLRYCIESDAFPLDDFFYQYLPQAHFCRLAGDHVTRLECLSDGQLLLAIKHPDALLSCGRTNRRLHRLVSDICWFKGFLLLFSLAFSLYSL